MNSIGATMALTFSFFVFVVGGLTMKSYDAIKMQRARQELAVVMVESQSQRNNWCQYLKSITENNEYNIIKIESKEKIMKEYNIEDNLIGKKRDNNVDKPYIFIVNHTQGDIEKLNENDFTCDTETKKKISFNNNEAIYLYKEEKGFFYFARLN